MQDQSAAKLRSGHGFNDRLGVVQHKREAWWFYRFLSIVYDPIVNPCHWTQKMRREALSHAELTHSDLEVLDVGGGTGFCTEGILDCGIPATNVSMLDQSPHQMRKAKGKPRLKDVRFYEGDAENLPFDTGSFDRYVSAGSIEYWPEPQRGIHEAFRILKPDGVATIIGPERATHWFSRWMCDLWMLFPEEAEYEHWFRNAGFEEFRIHRICPEHFGGIRKHGLIMGIVATGKKTSSSNPVIELPPKSAASEQAGNSFFRSLLIPLRLAAGAVGGGYYFLLGFLLPVLAKLSGRNQS